MSAHRDYTQARLELADLDLTAAIARAEAINNDGEADGLQPIEIRFLLEQVKEERRTLNQIFATTPYGGGMVTSEASLTAKYAALRTRLQAVAEENHAREEELRQLKHDVAAVGRILSLAQFGAQS